MTKAGNELRIRHSEVGHEPVGETGEKDYLFMRLHSLVWLMLKRTWRLSEVERKTPTVRKKRRSERPMAMARKEEKSA